MQNLLDYALLEFRARQPPAPPVFLVTVRPVAFAPFAILSP
jgi:hypothetical protein